MPSARSTGNIRCINGGAPPHAGSDEERRRPLNETLLSTAEAAQILGVTPRTVRLWVTEGTLPRHEPGRPQQLIRIRALDLLAFIEDPPKRISTNAFRTLVGRCRVSELPKETLFQYATEF